MAHSTGRLKPIIKKLYEARNELQSLFPQLRFTLDGKLLGDIGEAIAIQEFGLSKLPEGTKKHDCVTRDGKRVQVKATQETQPGGMVGMGWDKKPFEHLLVLQITEDGNYDILYNGPGGYISDAWNERTERARPDLALSKLGELNSRVGEGERLKRQG